MDKLITNVGLHHLADHIFGFVDNYSLAQCMLVCKDWNHFLARTILVRHFDNLLTLKRNIWSNVYEEFECIYLSSDWNEAAPYIRQQCSLDDLKEIIKVLVEWFYVFFEKTYLFCPLQYAAWEGYEDFFKIILRTSINLNKTDTDSFNGSVCPPIFTACNYGQINIVKILLDAKENGAKIDIYGRLSEQRKTSILFEAVWGCNVEMVKLVLERSKSIGLDINFNLCPGQPFTVLNYACKLKTHGTEIVRLILDHAKKNGITIKLFPQFLHGVVSTIDVGVLKLLLERYDETDLNLNERENCSGKTVFTEAASRCEQPEILSILLDFAHKREEFNVNVPDSDGRDILQCVVQRGELYDTIDIAKMNAKIVKAILKRAHQHHFDLNHKNNAGHTTLLVACNSTRCYMSIKYKSVDMCPSLKKVKLLLDFANKRKIKLQIYGFQNLNRSILQAKISEGPSLPEDIKIVKMLISRRKEIGLDLNHKDDNGMTAYDLLVLNDLPNKYCMSEQKQKIAELLKKENEDRKQCIIL